MARHFSDIKTQQFSAAVKEGNLRLVESLSLDAEVDLNRQESFGETPFYHACILGHVEIVRFLLDFHDNQRTIDYNCPDSAGCSPFFQVCTVSEELTEMLLADERIDVNQATDAQRTPLWWITIKGLGKMAKIMVASGRELDTVRRDFHENKNPIEMAREWRKEEIVRVLEAFERDPRAVRAQLRRELGYSDADAGEIFALMVYLSDGYLKIPNNKNNDEDEDLKVTEALKFFALAPRLPMDLQMVLCRRMFEMEGSIVLGRCSERGFRKFAKGF